VDIRPARKEDVPAIVGMLADDPLGASRETPDDLAPYYAAFERIENDPHQHLMFAVKDGKPAGTFQLSIQQGLGRRGASRAVIEAVRMQKDMRGEGLGTELMRWAIARSRELGASLVQLTSDNTRADAHRFYERLGFARTHVGYKMPL
jgi:GNAT superfamily N-acetyltransferase